MSEFVSELERQLHEEADAAAADAENIPTTTPATPPPIARKLSELVRVECDDDPAELLKSRYLCRGGGLLLAGPTGIGKSSFAIQAALLWSIGKPCMEIVPARPLKSLIIQAENDDGDLAEMRDGVLAGLDFTPVQAQKACDSILVCREDIRFGSEFWAECVRPLMTTQDGFDLLWVDPVLSYLGGEVNSQRDVGGFLRNGLNPILREFNAGGIALHHTNKPPSGKEKPDWAHSDFAYLGAGSAEWANWARAVLAIRATGQQGVFELRAGKRGSRIGWRDAEDNTAFARYIGHSQKPGVICWREVDEAEVSKPGRPKSFDDDTVLALLPDGGMTSTEWSKAAEESLISESTWRRIVRKLQSEERVIKSKASGKWQPILK